MATSTRTRSPFQAPAEDGVSVVYTLYRGTPSTGPEEKANYLNREHVEYINAEATIAVVNGNSRGSYKILVRTPLAPSEVFAADADALKTDQDGGGHASTYYARLRDAGIWFEVL